MKIKNSNKILILVLFLTVAIPLLVARIFLHKVRTNQFVIESKYADPALRTEGSLAGVKAVKLVGLNREAYRLELLSAAVVHNARQNYIVQKDHKEDSLMIQRVGDTLVFTYYRDSAARALRRWYSPIQIRLNLSQNIPVYAVRCRVSYSPASDTLAFQHALPARFYLDSGAVLQLGASESPSRVPVDTSLSEQVAFMDLAPTAGQRQLFDATFAPMGAVQVYADSSTVRMDQPMTFKALQLILQHHSGLEMNHPFKTDQLTGCLQEHTSLKGEIRAVKSVGKLLQ